MGRLLRGFWAAFELHETPDQKANRSGSSRLGRIVVALWLRAIASILPIR